MEVRVNSRELYEALLTVNRAVTRRPTIAILSNVLLEADQCRLTLSGTDLDVSVSVTIPADTAGTVWAITTNCRLLRDWIKPLLPKGRKAAPPVAELRPVPAGPGRQRLDVTIGCATSHFETMPACDYPALLVMPAEGQGNCLFPGHELYGHLKAAARSVSPDETRYTINAVCLELANSGQLSVMSTDGNRAYWGNGIEAVMPIKQALVPAAALNAWLPVLAKAYDNVEGHITEAVPPVLSLRAGNVTISARLLEGQFPTFENIIPTYSDLAFELHTDTLRRAVETAVKVAPGNNHAVKLDFELDTPSVTVSTETPDGAHSEQSMAWIKREITNVPPGTDNLKRVFPIGFNGCYLLDVLDQLGGEAVKVSFNGNDRAALLTNPADSGKLTVLMPIRP